MGDLDMMKQDWRGEHDAGLHRLLYARGADLRSETVGAAMAGLIQAMPRLRLREYFSCKPDVLSSADHVIIAYDTARRAAVATLASRWYHAYDRPFLHIATLLIGEAQQRTGLIKQLFRVHCIETGREHGIPSVLAMRTYNPHAYRAMCAFAGVEGVALYPGIRRLSQDPELRGLASEVAKVVSPGLEFCPDTGVIRGGAAGVPVDFYPSLEETRDTAINHYFARHLTPADRLLCMLVSRSEAAREKIARALGVPGKRT
ncbi:MAG: hypothetical protein QM820_34055 [Minicystis sp.]